MELYSLVLYISGIYSFNVDTDHVVNIKEAKGGYFGYSALMFANGEDKWAFVGATKANFTTTNLYKSPGNVFKCRLNFTSPQQEKCTAMNLKQTDIFRWPNSPGYEEDNELLGASMAMIDDTIVICAPLWKNCIPWRSHHILYPFGRCFNVNKTLTSYSSIPFKSSPLRKSTESPINNPQFFYEFAQIGFSMSSKKYQHPSHHVLLGAPGFLENEGGFVQYNDKAVDADTDLIDVFTRVKFKDRIPFHFGDLLGYSITTGNIYNNSECQNVVVVGAPHYISSDGIVGAVFVVKYQNKEIEMLKQITGHKSGGGFGTSVVFQDVNNDGLDDLFVGEPMYFDNTTNIIDAGVVHIYYGYNDPTIILDESPQVLTGSGKPFGRFGTAIQCVNDINKDDYNDIAVSAPYEDDMKGAIYIYHGGASELTLTQRITPKDIRMDLHSFGWYISTAYDIDDNQYPDFVIGSYLSDTVSILRSRPIITLDMSMDFNPTVIPLNSSGLFCQDELFRPCVTLQIRFNYSGDAAPKTIIIAYNVTSDTLRTRGIPKRSSRVYLTNEEVTKDGEVFQGQAEVSLFDGHCVNMSAVVKSYNRAFLIHSDEELAFELSVKLVERISAGNVPPILDNSPTLKQASINFSTVCTGDCRPDLRIQITLDPMTVFIEEYSDFILIVHVYNDGDKALGAEIVIQMSNNTKYLNYYQPQIDLTELVTCVNSALSNQIKCNLINTFFKETIIHLRFAINNTLLITDGINHDDVAGNISFTAFAESKSTDRDISDNQMTLTTFISTRSTIEISGMSVPVELHLTDDGDSYLNYTHKYHILNHGPSPLINGRMYVCLPVYHGNTNSITPENVKVNARSHDTTVRILHFHKGQWYRNLSGTPETPDPISCHLNSSETFLLVKVEVHMLNRYNEIKVHIQFSIKENSLDFGQLTKLVYTSVAEIDLRDDERYITIAVNKTFSVSSIIYKEKAVSSKTIKSDTDKVNPWIIVGSAFGGLAVLIIVTLILRKCGFFRRPKRELMIRFKRHKHNHRRNRVFPEGTGVPRQTHGNSVQGHDNIPGSSQD